MRIPPSAAQEIGSVQASARTFETTASTCKESSALLTKALDTLRAGANGEALANARKAAELLGSFVYGPSRKLDARLTDLVREAMGSAEGGASSISSKYVETAALLLQYGVEAADAATKRANDEAQSLRHYAQSLVERHI